MSKVIKFAGISRVNGELKFRTAADEKRIAQLIKLGDTDVNLVAVEATTKSEAARVLLAVNFMADNAEVQALLWNMSEQKAPAKKAEKEVRVRVAKPKAAKPVPPVSREELAIQRRYWQNNVVGPAMAAISAEAVTEDN